MNAYAYRAALYCEECAENVITATPLADWPQCRCGAEYSEHSCECEYSCCPQGFYPDKFPHYGPKYSADETAYDSGDFPKGPYPDGGGEADAPQHCDDCGVFLENPLTRDGIEYVESTISNFDEVALQQVNADVISEWRDFYADALAQQVNA